MRIPTWRVVLTVGAIAILVAGGIGLVAAAGAPAAPASNVVAAGASLSPSNRVKPDRGVSPKRLEKRAAMAASLLRIGRHVVHIEATITDKDGKLITVWLDHGTVQSVGAGSLTISEAGGATRTVRIDAETIVRVGRGDGSLADVNVGAEVFVQSRVDAGNPLAKRIRIIPAQVD